MSFVDSIARQVGAVRPKGMAPEDVRVRVTLANGEALMFNGLTVRADKAEPGVYLLASVAGDSSAVVVRDDHVFLAEIAVEGPNPPIGIGTLSLGG